jgi:hypothetical protein
MTMQATPVDHVAEDDLVLHYYGELAAADEARVTAHISDCRECHDAYRRLQQVLMSVNDTALATPELPDGFERIVWARLEPNLQRGHTGWLSRLVSSPSHLGWAVAAVLIAVGAFYAGRLSPRGPEPAPTTPVTASISAPGSSQLRERILLVDLSEHLDRSQRVLVELVSAEGGGTATLSGERHRAEQLVADNRLYRETASANGDASVVELLDQLERVLVELAASPSNLSPKEMDEVRRRIDSGSLLFKVRVVSSDLRERRKAAMRQTGQRSSL